MILIQKLCFGSINVSRRPSHTHCVSLSGRAGVRLCCTATLTTWHSDGSIHVHGFVCAYRVCYHTFVRHKDKILAFLIQQKNAAFFNKWKWMQNLSIWGRHFTSRNENAIYCTRQCERKYCYTKEHTKIKSLLAYSVEKYPFKFKFMHMQNVKKGIAPRSTRSHSYACWMLMLVQQGKRNIFKCIHVRTWAIVYGL